jgi:hypothetical protein
VKRRKIAKIRRLSRAYLAASPRTKTACGQSLRACAEGMAECTPKTRAS